MAMGGEADGEGSIDADKLIDIIKNKFEMTIDIENLIEEIDEDGSGLLEFGEFCQLAAKFLVEEDDEALKKELKEAFRIYDKDQQGYITTGMGREGHWRTIGLDLMVIIL